jgi:hypothetical protein
VLGIGDISTHAYIVRIQSRRIGVLTPMFSAYGLTLSIRLFWLLSSSDDAIISVMGFKLLSKKLVRWLKVNDDHPRV